MKRYGSKCEHEDARNDDLMNTYLECIRRCNRIRLPQIMEHVVNSPSVRFWVSEERTGIVVSRMDRGDSLSGMNRMKREMFGEIYRRVCAMRREHPEMKQTDIIFKVVRQPAPKFYLTPGSANVIIHRIKKQWLRDRKRNMQHS